MAYEPVDAVLVTAWGREVGALALDSRSGYYAFEYTPAWRRTGIELAPLDAPHQGLQKTVDVFGMPSSIGFYNTFTARVPAGTTVVGEIPVREVTGR